LLGSAIENTPHTWIASGASGLGSKTTLSTRAYTATRSLAYTAALAADTASAHPSACHLFIVPSSPLKTWQGGRVLTGRSITCQAAQRVGDLVGVRQGGLLEHLGKRRVRIRVCDAQDGRVERVES